MNHPVIIDLFSFSAASFNADVAKCAGRLFLQGPDPFELEKPLSPRGQAWKGADQCFPSSWPEYLPSGICPCQMCPSDISLAEDRAPV